MTFEWTKQEAQMIKRLWSNPETRPAMQLIIEELGMLHRPSFNPDSHITAFNEGRRYVAIALTAAINADLRAEDDGSSDTNRSPIPTATERAAVRAAEGAAGATKRRRIRK
jgi:hypothetical protein